MRTRHDESFEVEVPTLNRMVRLPKMVPSASFWPSRWNRRPELAPRHLEVKGGPRDPSMASMLQVMMRKLPMDSARHMAIMCSAAAAVMGFVDEVNHWATHDFTVIQ